MIIAQKIAAKNTPSGNPNRGWLIYDVREDDDYPVAVAFVDEGYKGSAALREFDNRHMVELPVIHVAPQVVNDARREGRLFYR
jgi:uncharacterized protein (DUF169 family)